MLQGLNGLYSNYKGDLEMLQKLIDDTVWVARNLCADLKFIENQAQHDFLSVEYLCSAARASCIRSYMQQYDFDGDERNLYARHALERRLS